MNFNLHLISDFNLDLLKRVIESKKVTEINSVNTSSYGQLYQAIFSFEEDLNAINFIWSLPENHIKTFQSALNFEEINKTQLEKEVEEYANLVVNLSKKCKFVLLPLWQRLPHYKTYGIIDLKIEFGILKLINEMNLLLSNRFKNVSNVYLIDSSEWQLNNLENMNPKIWYLAKTPFSNFIYRKVSETIISSIKTLSGNNKKLLIVDLDNTLWGGLIGELSYKGINIGGHNHIGEAFLDFQKSLLSLHNRGILLAIASKNDEGIALQAFKKNSEMILREDHFVAKRINWNDKANNIIEIAKDVNIGLDSVVFIDDNPVEREHIKITLPEVFVPDWSLDPSMYTIKLNSLRCFDQVSFTTDDKHRNKTYLENKLRESSKERIINKDNWLKELNTIVEIGKLTNGNLKRITQLFNKTNQFNLTTRRLSEDEIKKYYSIDENHLITIDVKDKFGQLGLVGIIGLSRSSDITLNVVDLILSCRAMGRGIEETMLYLISKNVKDTLAKRFLMNYKKSAKNNPVLHFLKSTKLENEKDSKFHSNNINNFPKPDSVKIIYKK